MNHDYGFYDAGTEKIVEEHASDFNSNTESTFLKSHGGYWNYVKSLGGVFTKYAGKTITGRTQADFEAACNYVWGLCSIYGINYSNGTGVKAHHYTWGNGSVDRYYVQNPPGRYSYYGGRSVDDMLQHKGGKPLATNCNYMLTLLFGKYGVPLKYSTTNHKDSYIKSVRATKITSKSQLRPGDLIHFHDSSGKWHHVAIVGRTSDNKVYLYDGGSRWITARKREFEFEVTAQNEPAGVYDYGSGGYWIGVRYFDLAQDIPYKNRTDTQLAAEVMLEMHGKGDGRKKDLGSRYDKVQAIVETLAKNHTKLIDSLTDYVLDGLAGKGDERKRLLGEYYDEVQKRVTYIWNAAEDVWANKYSTGETRRKALGTDYDIIMRQVNRTKERHT